MATTEAQVANLALGMVGQRQLVDSLDEATTEAQLCKAFFAPTRQALMQAFAWRFATKREVLALSTEERTGWEYCYAAPATMLLEAPAYVYSGEREPGEGARTPFAIELNDGESGHLICTDMEDAEFVFQTDVRTVALWPPLFVEAMAAALAVRLAPALAGKPQLIPMLEAAAKVKLLQAMAASGNAAQRDVAADAESIRVRG